MTSTPELRKLIEVAMRYQRKYFEGDTHHVKIIKALEIALDALDEIKSHSSNCYICDSSHIAKVNLAKCESAAKGDV